MIKGEVAMLYTGSFLERLNQFCATQAHFSGLYCSGRLFVAVEITSANG
jgi:hypothetical protein